MTQFHPGDRVRCIVSDGSNLLTLGAEYTIAEYDATWTMLRPRFSVEWFAEQLFAPIAEQNTPGIGAEEQEPCSGCDRNVQHDNLCGTLCDACYAAYPYKPLEMRPLSTEAISRAREAVKALGYGMPKSSGIPSTARAIMGLVPERKVQPLTEKQQLQGENIARAVQNLSRHENRLGASRYQP